MSKKLKDNFITGGIVLLAVFFSQLFLGHEAGVIETFKGHITGRFPLPLWSYAMLIGGIGLMLYGRYKQ